MATKRKKLPEGTHQTFKPRKEVHIVMPAEERRSIERDISAGYGDSQGLPPYVKRKAPKSRAYKAMSDLLGGAFGVINNTFRLMEVAEDVIREAKEDNPDHAEVIDRAFGIACPSIHIHGKSDAVYIAHVKELIDRLVLGADTRPGTKAEVLCVMLETSFRAPLTQNGQALVEALWAELMPHAPMDYGDGIKQQAQPRWEGALEETLAECRRKLTDNDRVIRDVRRG